MVFVANMSKLCILVLLFYNVAITICLPAEYGVNTYDDRADDARFNFFELLKTFDEINSENRREATNPDLENWTGRWMPDRSDNPTPPPKVWPVTDRPHGSMDGISMGPRRYCDDGKTNLTLDWDNSPVNYTCYGTKITPDFDINPLLYSETIPPGYMALHKCMNDVIVYDQDIPLYGTHRPVWPVYGEYKFLPPQRWLHSLEHGAVVMLYHPCANPLEVKSLKTLVKNCLRRHIISPSNLLDEDRPLVLLTWGYRLSMSYVNPKIVKDFIREKSLHGPEKIPLDGRFRKGLVSRSQIVSDFDDSTVCPNM